MHMETKIKSELYHLVVDHDRNKILKLFLTAASHDTMIVGVLSGMGLIEQYTELITEMSDKEHALNWCKDPDCKKKNI